jgi:uncharacterized repeat protein (TIGR01451 family)
MKILLLLLALLSPMAAQAADGVSLDSKVLVEHSVTAPDGETITTLEEPSIVTPGDSLVFRLTYRNDGAEPATGFMLTNPIPESVAFVGTDDPDAVVSVDDGKTWGALASLTVAQPDGTSRPAQPADVTHIRWSFAQALSSGATGELSFRGVVE